VGQLPDFEDYNMTNRTYRYFKGEPVFPFGYGLSYTTFDYETPALSSEVVSVGDEATLTLSVTNSGDYDGEEVVQLYLQKPDDAEGPLLTLRGFKRVFIAKGEKVDVKFQLTPEVLEWWNADAQRMTPLAGDYRLLVGSSSRPEDLEALALKVVAP
jgi:beta-glucosidase